MSPNLSTMHRETAERLGEGTAIRHHGAGAWCDLSWRGYRDRADAAALFLAGLGIGRGDRVALFAENRVEWLIADHAILTLGAITVPLHATLSPVQVDEQLRNSGANVLVASGRLLDGLGDPILACRRVVDFDATQPEDQPNRLSWDLGVTEGIETLHHGGGTRDTLLAREAETSVEHPATIIYTSGTTGGPKGVVLTHGNLLSNAAATLERTSLLGDDVLASWLPYSHVYARTVDHYLTTMAGMTIGIARSPDTVLEDLATIEPTWMTAVPRLYEKVWTAVQSLDADARRTALRGVFGERMHELHSGGAPLPPDICRGYHEAGLMLLEGYGLTESSPVISFNSAASFRIGTVGRPLPGVEVRIAEDGEVLTKGPHVMAGYWERPEATAEAIHDGWLRTGDLGLVDEDGFLAITGRKKELLVLSNGKNVVPNQVEALLMNDALVEQVVVFGDRLPYCVALVVPQPDRLAEECAALGIEPVEHDRLLDVAPVVDRLVSRLEPLQANLSPHERVRRLALLSRPFTVEDGDLTASFKLRRGVIAESFADVIASLYN